MSALQCTDLQDERGLVASESNQPARTCVLPPFSGKLSADEGLKLSNQKFKQLIENTLNTISQMQRKSAFLALHLPAQFASKSIYHFHKGKIVQHTATPVFPTPHVLAQLAFKAYEDYKKVRLTLSMRHG